MPISIVPYNPIWGKWFKELTKPMWDKIGEYVVDIVHVGSTSIEGMSAKPVIDIDIVVEDWIKFPDIVRGLDELGYTHQGNLITEREAFKLNKQPKYQHNLYVCHKYAIAYRNHILLKKHLNENKPDFIRYQALKIDLVKTSINIDEYCRAKTDLILEFLKAEGLTDEALMEIRGQNL